MPSRAAILRACCRARQPGMPDRPFPAAGSGEALLFIVIGVTVVFLAALMALLMRE